MTKLLTLQGVSLNVGDAAILSAIDFHVAAGEIVGVAGRNGAGKSSLLRLICAELPPSSGDVSLDGVYLETLPPRERAMRIAMLPQSSTLQFDFKLEEVVALGLAPHGVDAAAGLQAVGWAIEACDLEAVRERSYQTLSGGEQQRVHLARVLVQLSPGGASDDLGGRVLLLDEPTSAMDLPHQERCLALLRSLAKRGCAVVAVLHDINLLARIADQLLLLRGGRVQAQGSLDEVLTEEQLTRLYQHPIRIIRPSPDSAPIIQAANLDTF